jgi:signal transduction histidine kinase
MKQDLKLLPFQARARTVDHLGREQIADSPTAVSELWKNAYDAYATNVSLHVFEGPPAVAAIMDDGHGMSAAEFVDRWLVVGTDVKLTEPQAEEDRLGLPPRERQGQKGIGRLSVGFLGPLFVVLSKRPEHNFLISAVDWRVFENPYLSLHDVVIPVAEFEGQDDFDDAFASAIEALAENIWPRGDDVRAVRVRDGWRRYSQHELDHGTPVSTQDRIAASVVGLEITSEVLGEWQPWSLDKRHGTALLVFEPKAELRVLVAPGVASSTAEAQELRENLVATLTGFVDPYDDGVKFFDYKVVAHYPNRAIPVVSADEQFSRADFKILEHTVSGCFDEAGVFVGEVRAFGRSFGTVRFAPAAKYRDGKSPVGPFDFSIGTFEQDARNTTHTDEQHFYLSQKASIFAGLRVYRDGLRVMPYGRPDVDFFGLEARRAQHAGREFWQHHRVFGRVAFTRRANPSLRDKAGREGLIDNPARRELRNLVVDLLKHLARAYFGTNSDIRNELLTEIQAENRAAREARSSARKALTRDLLSALKKNRAAVDQVIVRSTELLAEIQTAAAHRVPALELALSDLIEQTRVLRLPARAGKLGASESKYLDYREQYRRALGTIEQARALLRQKLIDFDDEVQGASVSRHLARRRSELVLAVNSAAKSLTTRLAQERTRVQDRAGSDRFRIHGLAATLTESLLNPTSATLHGIDDQFDDLKAEIASFYERYEFVLERLASGIDVGLVLTSTLYEAAELQQRVGELNALAQMGITVEIVTHEFERLDREIRDNFDGLPAAVKVSLPFKQASVAYETLVNRLRFLSPLQVSGSRFKERITGSFLSAYVRDFFGSRFEEDGVVFTSTTSFEDISIFDYPYRILPVFVNLVNNSLYWLQFVTSKAIMFDASVGAATIADSGPGVDPEDVESLFGLFFTRRSAGRGIGLYLAKANLGASGHSIEYRQGGPVLGGANFIITFKGMTYASPEL